MTLRAAGRHHGRTRRRALGLAAGVASMGLAVGCPALASVVSTTSAGAAQVSVPGPATVQVAQRPTLPSGARSTGAIASSKLIAGDVALLPRNPTLLKAYATAASTPGSPEYHHYLSLSSLQAAFAPTTATVRALEDSLRSAGLRVTTVSANRLLVGFSGPASKVEAAFHTTIATYRLAGGRRVFANTAAARLPRALAASVEGVFGLNDLLTPSAAPLVHSTKVRAAKPTTVATTPPAGSANACRDASLTATEDSGLTANQVAYAYGLDPLYQQKDFGQGQTVDILDLFGYAQSDISAFDNCYFGSTGGPKVLANDSATAVDNGAQPGNGTGGSVETELDVESVNAYAPGAKADVYEAPDTDAGFLDDIAAMTASSANIETISYGECEELAQAEEPGYTQIENYLFEQAATMGKTVFASSADNGDDTCSSDSGAPVAPVLSDSDPASQPFVTGVGGTAITAATDPPAQEVWNDGAAGGSGGGGISAIWPEPAWQAATKVPGVSSKSIISAAEQVDGNDFCQDLYSASTACREVPDVSAQASPNTGGFPVVLDGYWTQYGGTSLASPTWAATLADIDSTASCTTAGGVGFLSPKLYAIASTPSEYKASFDDITVGNNDNFGAAGGLYPATVGYDMASGLGTPQVTGAGGSAGLAHYLCSTPSTQPPTLTAVGPPALSSEATGAGTATLTISGHGFSGVAAVSIGSVTVPSSDVTVTDSTSISVKVPSDLFSLETGNGGSADGSGTYAVIVTLEGGATSSPGADATLTLYDSGAGAAGTTPVVDGTFPNAGVEAGGTSVTIYGSGLSTASSVTFGGRAATSFKVLNDNTIQAVTPAEPSPSACVSGDDPSTGVCQVQVQVTLADGTATSEGTIPLDYSGALADVSSVAGTYPASTEYDYEPPPTITSITYPDGLASEGGGTKAIVNGTGLGYLGLEWLNVGSYKNTGSLAYSPISVSSTQLVVYLPAETATSAPLTLPVTVQTYGSPNEAPGQTLGSVAPSDTLDVTYAPVPAITKLTGGVRGSLAGPTSGGSRLTITGSGFDGFQVAYFVDLKYGFPATQYAPISVSNSKVVIDTPAALTGRYAVEICGVSGCSDPSARAYTFYLPGNPTLTASKPKTGTKGTKVTITGHNLGWVSAVYFGSKRALSFSQPAFFESGNTYQVTAVAPAGTAGKKVDLRVVTVESEATGYGKSRVNKQVTFTYAKKK